VKFDRRALSRDVSAASIIRGSQVQRASAVRKTLRMALSAGPQFVAAIQRAEQADLVTSRKIGNTRLVRANTASPYYSGLTEILTRAFGVPAVLAEALSDVNGIIAAYIYGSWAARH
jgi:hypothetical protein